MSVFSQAWIRGRTLGVSMWRPGGDPRSCWFRFRAAASRRPGGV